MNAANFNLEETSDTTGVITFECTLDAPEDFESPGTKVHFKGRIEVTRIDPDAPKAE